MEAIKHVLDVFDPRVWYMSAGLIVFLLTWAWRRFLPALYAAAVAKSPVIPQLWMAVVGALIGAAPAIGKPMLQAVEEVLVTAALTAVGANGLHAVLKASPLPYNGAETKVAAAFVKRATPAGGLPPLDKPPV